MGSSSREGEKDTQRGEGEGIGGKSWKEKKERQNILTRIRTSSDPSEEREASLKRNKSRDVINA